MPCHAMPCHAIQYLRSSPQGFSVLITSHRISKVKDENLRIYKCFYKRWNTYWTTIRSNLNLAVKTSSLLSFWKWLVIGCFSNFFRNSIPNLLLYLNHHLGTSVPKRSLSQARSTFWYICCDHYNLICVLRLCMSERFLKRLHRYDGALPLIILKIIWTSLYSNIRGYIDSMQKAVNHVIDICTSAWRYAKYVTGYILFVWCLVEVSIERLNCFLSGHACVS